MYTVLMGLLSTLNLLMSVTRTWNTDGFCKDLTSIGSAHGVGPHVYVNSCERAGVIALLPTVLKIVLRISGAGYDVPYIFPRLFRRVFNGLVF